MMFQELTGVNSGDPVVQFGRRKGFAEVHVAMEGAETENILPLRVLWDWLRDRVLYTCKRSEVNEMVGTLFKGFLNGIGR